MFLRKPASTLNPADLIWTCGGLDLEVDPGPTPSVHLFLFARPCHAGRTRFLLFNYWKVFLTWVTGTRCQEELCKPGDVAPACLRRRESRNIALVWVVLPPTPPLRTGLQSTKYTSLPTTLPWSNKSPEWYIYTARRNALGSRKWKAGLVIILILRRLTQTSIQSRLWSSTVRAGHAGRFLLNESCPIWKWLRAVWKWIRSNQRNVLRWRKSTQRDGDCAASTQLTKGCFALGWNFTMRQRKDTNYCRWTYFDLLKAYKRNSHVQPHKMRLSGKITNAKSSWCMTHTHKCWLKDSNQPSSCCRHSDIMTARRLTKRSHDDDLATFISSCLSKPVELM